MNINAKVVSTRPMTNTMRITIDIQHADFATFNALVKANYMIMLTDGDDDFAEVVQPPKPPRAAKPVDKTPLELEIERQKEAEAAADAAAPVVISWSEGGAVGLQPAINTQVYERAIAPHNGTEDAPTEPKSETRPAPFIFGEHASGQAISTGEERLNPEDEQTAPAESVVLHFEEEPAASPVAPPAAPAAQDQPDIPAGLRREPKPADVGSPFARKA